MSNSLPLSVHDFICANCRSTPLSRSPALQAHMLARSRNGPLKGPWLCVSATVVIYAPVEAISLRPASDYECQFQSVPASIHHQKTNLTIGLSSTTGSRPPAENPLHPTQNNVKHCFVPCTDYEDEDQLQQKQTV